MMWYDGGGMHWCGWLLGAFMMVAFWDLIISSTRSADPGCRRLCDGSGVPRGALVTRGCSQFRIRYFCARG
jgi:hypothetical protein